MKHKRILCTGDIHGCLNSLKRLMEKVKPTEDDKLIFTGDYIDRQEDSIPETIDYLIELKEQFPETVFLKGNHEDMFIKFLKEEADMNSWRVFVYNGGEQTLQQYARYLNIKDDLQAVTWNDLPEKHKYFFDNLAEMYIDSKNGFIAVHAGLRPEVDLLSQDAYDCIWIRQPFLQSPYEWGDFKIVHGHTPMTPMEAKRYHDKYPSRFNVDTGCVFGYNLTCIDILSGEVYSVLSELYNDRMANRGIYS